MAKKTETMENVRKTFSKKAMYESKRYREQRDLIEALLNDDREYTHEEVEALINDFMTKKEVK